MKEIARFVPVPSFPQSPRIATKTCLKSIWPLPAHLLWRFILLLNLLHKTEHTHVTVNLAANLVSACATGA